jgi:phosphoesterase RecJ-like protein
MNKLDKIASLLKDAGTVAIICHVNPDPDTICSALALYHTLIYFNKKVHIFCSDEPAGKVARIPGAELINKAYYPSYNICVCVDCSDMGRLGEDADVFFSAKHTINLDHHKTNTEFAEFNYIEPYASATAEVIYKLILRLDPDSINDKIAQLLYTGIVADSGAFAFSSTSPDTMVIAGELMRYNFSASDVCYDMTKKIKKSVFNLKMRALKGLTTYDNNTIGIIKFFRKDFAMTRTTREDTSGIINDVINIENIKIAIAITETEDDVYKVSLRSKDSADVAKVSEAFGGGGHKNAAGCELRGELETVVKKLLIECRRELCKES